MKIKLYFTIFSILISYLYFFFRNIILYSKYFIKKDIINIIEEIYSKFGSKYVSGDIFYFVFGYYLNKINTKNIKLELIIYFFGLIGIIFGGKISSNISNKEKKTI